MKKHLCKHSRVSLQKKYPPTLVRNKKTLTILIKHFLFFLFLTEELERKMAAETKCEYNFLGKTGLKVSNICLGTMTFGSSDKGPIGVVSLNHYITLKLTFRSPWGELSTPGFVCSQHTVSRNIKLAQALPSQSTNSNLDRVEPRRFISCAQRNSHEASVGFVPRTSRFAVERAITGPTRPKVILKCNKHS